jgi:hypothetical protein
MVRYDKRGVLTNTSRENVWGVILVRYPTDAFPNRFRTCQMPVKYKGGFSRIDASCVFANACCGAIAHNDQVAFPLTRPAFERLYFIEGRSMAEICQRIAVTNYGLRKQMDSWGIKPTKNRPQSAGNLQPLTPELLRELRFESPKTVLERQTLMAPIIRELNTSRRDES